MAPAEGVDGDWRSKLQPNSRRIVINKIVDTLKSFAPISDQGRTEYFQDIATKFEAKIYAAASSQNDYLLKISSKLHAARLKSNMSVQNAVPPNSAATNRYPQTPAIQNLQPQVQNQGQPPPAKLETNQLTAQGHQQLLVQDAQYNITSAGMASASLSSPLPPANSLPQQPVSNVIRNPNMQNISGVSQDLNSQMHIQGGQSIRWVGSQHQIHPSQNPQKFINQQHQTQQELLNQEIHEGGAQHTLLQPCVQPQQKMSNPFQLQSAQQHYQERSPLESHVGDPSHSGVPSKETKKNLIQTMQQPEISVQQPSLNASMLLSGCGQQHSRQEEMTPQISAQMVQLQKQFAQSQRTSATGESTFPDSATQAGDSGDWKEEVYQKVKVLKEKYIVDLIKVYQSVFSKLQQLESAPQQYHADRLEGLRKFKRALECLSHYLQLTKSNIQQQHKDIIGCVEKKIIDILSSQMLRKPGPQLPHRQLPPPHGQSLQQNHDCRMNSNPHPVNLQASSIRTMQPITTSSLHGSGTSSSAIISLQQRMMNTLQSASNVNLRHESARISGDQVSVGLVQHNPSDSEQTSSRQGGMDLVRLNISSEQPKSGQPHEHEAVQQAQKWKQTYQHNHIQKNSQPHQKEQQQIHVQRIKQQEPGQPQTHQLSEGYLMNNAIELKMRQGMEPGNRSQEQHKLIKTWCSGPYSRMQIPQTMSNKNNQHTFSQIDQKSRPLFSKVGTPLQSTTSPSVALSPSNPLAPGDHEKPGNAVSSQLSAAKIASKTSLAIEAPQEQVSSFSAELMQPDGNGRSLDTISGKSGVLQQPFERLLKVMQSLSSKALSASVSEINSVVSMTDQLAGPQPGSGSAAAVADNLSFMTRCRLQDKNWAAPEKSIGFKRTWDHTNSMSLDDTSLAGSPKYSFKQFTGSGASDLDLSATFGAMRRGTETNPDLLEEIREVNEHLIDTVVDVFGPNLSASGAEGDEGTVVKCSFIGVSLCPTLKSQFASGNMSPIQPLRVLIPGSYPNCSPLMLDKHPVAFRLSKEYDDLCLKAQTRFNISLRTLSEPMSVMEVARSWDHCIRSFIIEYAQLHGGGTFTTKFGAFKDCLSVA